MTYESGRGQVTIDGVHHQPRHIVIRAADLTAAASHDLPPGWRSGLRSRTALASRSCRRRRRALPPRAAVVATAWLHAGDSGRGGGVRRLLCGARLARWRVRAARIVIEVAPCATRRVSTRRLLGEHLCDPWVQRTTGLRAAVVGICRSSGNHAPGVVSMRVLPRRPALRVHRGRPDARVRAFFDFIHAAQMLVMGITIFLFVDEYTLARPSREGLVVSEGSGEFPRGGTLEPALDPICAGGRAVDHAACIVNILRLIRRGRGPRRRDDVGRRATAVVCGHVEEIASTAAISRAATAAGSRRRRAPRRPPRSTAAPRGPASAARRPADGLDAHVLGEVEARRRRLADERSAAGLRPRGSASWRRRPSPTTPRL